METKHISTNGRKVLHLMSDGKPRTTRQIIIGADVTDGSREVRRLRDKGYTFADEWVTKEDGTRYKIWRLKNDK